MFVTFLKYVSVCFPASLDCPGPRHSRTFDPHSFCVRHENVSLNHSVSFNLRSNENVSSIINPSFSIRDKEDNEMFGLLFISVTAGEVGEEVSVGPGHASCKEKGATALSSLSFC